MNLLDFMRATVAVPCSQQPATGLSSPHLRVLRVFISFLSVLLNDAVRCCDYTGLVAGECVWSIGEMILTSRNEVLKEKHVSVPLLFTGNPASNPSLRRGSQATNCLSHGTDYNPSGSILTPSVAMHSLVYFLPLFLDLVLLCRHLPMCALYICSHVTDRSF
jgi:hypothetical protein